MDISNKQTISVMQNDAKLELRCAKNGNVTNFSLNNCRGCFVRLR